MRPRETAFLSQRHYTNAIAAKVVKTIRQLLWVKLRKGHRTLLEQVLLALKEFEPPPI